MNRRTLWAIAYTCFLLIAAFSSGGWDTVAEELTDEQKALAATQSVTIRKAEER